MESFELLLDARELTASLRAQTAISETPLTSEFFVGATDHISDTVEMIYHPGIAKPAPGASRGAEARRIVMGGATKRFMTFLHSFNVLPLKGEAFNALRRGERFPRAAFTSRIGSGGRGEHLPRAALGEKCNAVWFCH